MIAIMFFKLFLLQLKTMKKLGKKEIVRYAKRLIYSLHPTV